MIKYFLVVLILIFFIVITYDFIRMYSLFQKTVELEKKISPFERIKINSNSRILILGDSTAVGVGAEKNEDSIAGRLDVKYPDAEIINLAVSGLKIKGLEEIISKIDVKESFDIIIIQIGANDIIRFTSLNNIEIGINRILSMSEKFNGKVVFLHSGDIGKSLFFPWYIRPLLSSRSLSVKNIYQNAAASHSADYVNLIDSPSVSEIDKNTKLYYSADLLHLSGEGYALWYKEIIRFVILPL